MGVRLACLCVAFVALAGWFADPPASKLFKPIGRGPKAPNNVDARGRGMNPQPPSLKPQAIPRQSDERKTPLNSPSLAWVPGMIAVCCGMAIGAVAVALRFPRRMPRAFVDPMESAQSAAIEFIAGETEHCVPDVKLTRSPDGRVSTAVFTFDSPSILSNNADDEMTGMHLKDEEGTISTTDVNAQFIDGRPRLLVARVMLNGFDAWDRFMRWMDRYAKVNGLAFTPAVNLASFASKSSLADFTPYSSFSSMADALTDNGRRAYAY